MKEITIEVWGDFAAFNAPYAKVERLTYPFPTPSAARGILSAIYMKPKEFRWQINRIEVLNPIRYISFKRNEIKYTVSSEQISTEEERTQRQTTALQDVRYRIAASIIPRTAFAGKEIQLDAGLMVYDLFAPDDVEVTKKTKIKMSLFHAVMENGVILIPPYDSPEVLKGESLC